MLLVQRPLTLILLVLVSAYRLDQAVCISHSAWASALTPTQQVPPDPQWCNPTPRLDLAISVLAQR